MTHLSFPRSVRARCAALSGVLASAAVVLLPHCLPAAAPVSAPPLIEAKDGWQVRFDPRTSILECAHASLGARLAGALSFVPESKGAPPKWSVQTARDFAPQRLAIVDEHNDVQGYVAIRLEGARLSLLAIHRPPQLYGGELRYAPSAALGAGAFACRTRAIQESAVAQMASGAADSLLNDSIFDPNRDLALRLGGGRVVISTVAPAASQPPVFQTLLAASISAGESAVISLDLIPAYYRSAYVPKYHLIDRKRCPTAPTGWMSWNTYFDTAGEKENLDEARVGARFLKPFGLEIWSIESWQDNSPRLPVSSFYNLSLKASPEKFPHGMKWLAQEIRALGFRPGIWTVPWGTGDASDYQARKELFLHRPDGAPLGNWNGRYVLDPSLPEVRRLMEETHRTMAVDWGYEFFKIDGMSGRGPGYSAHFFESPAVQALFRKPVKDPYSLCVEALRRGIGPDRIFLACQGHYSGPEAAWADAARLGADIVEPNHPPRWANYLSQARVTLNQLFTHNLLWYNDPDTLLVGGPAPLNEARIATTVVALPGQLTFFGDKLAPLPSERMRLLQQALPVCDVHPLDLAPVHDLKSVWDLKIRRSFGAWDVVSLFNWGETPRQAGFTFASLGLDASKDYLLYEFWSRKFLGSFRGAFTNALDAHTSLLLAVHEASGRPQFLSTDRHVSQGGVELLAGDWNPAAGELSCVFKLVENDPLTAVIHAPASWKFLKARAEDAALEKVLDPAGPAVSVVIRRTTAGQGRVVLTFGKGDLNP